jgi:FkbM family methyltransferase
MKRARRRANFRRPENLPGFFYKRDAIFLQKKYHTWLYMATVTFPTAHGDVTLFDNDCYITAEFKKGKYWDEETLLELKQYIPANKNILEIGAHCGTSSLIYAKHIDDECKLYAYEPQKEMFNLLSLNAKQNGLENKIMPINKGVFCYSGKGAMNAIDLDGGGGNVQKRYTEEKDKPCNFGGVPLGRDGEAIELTTMDEMPHENIGFIHCDAQGAENFIFSKGTELLQKNRPVILFEHNQKHAYYLFLNVCSSYPKYGKNAKFDIIDYCMNELLYTKCIPCYRGSIDYLLIP